MARQWAERQARQQLIKTGGASFTPIVGSRSGSWVGDIVNNINDDF